MKTLRSAFAAAFAACTLSASAVGVDRFVDYLESSGNSSSKGQLILLDYTPCGTSRIVTTVAALDTTRTHGIFCARGNNTNVRTFTLFHIGNGGWRFDYFDNTGSPCIRAVDGQKYKLECSGTAFAVDDVKQQDRTTKDFKSDNRMALFASYTANAGAFTAASGANNSANVRLYGFEVWEQENGSEVKKLDLVPCVDDADRPALYDKVAGRLYYNESVSGGGDFSFGADRKASYVVFSSDKGALPMGETVTFTARSFADGTPIEGTSYEWNFGDGTTTNVTDSASVAHDYSASGVYDVSVRVRGENGFDESFWLKGVVTVFPSLDMEIHVAQSGGSATYPYDTAAKATPDLAQAVKAARDMAGAGASVTVLIDPGTYALNGELLVDSGIRLKGTGTREETILTQAVNNQRVLVVTDAILDTLTVQGGNFTQNWVDPNPTKIDNHAGYTMVLKKSGQDTLMTNCVVIGANSSNRTTLGTPGGGLAVYDATVRDSLLMGGDAKYENSGVLYLSSGLIYDTEITGGHSTQNGGGVWMNGGGKMVNCLIHGNVCDGSGGGARVTCWSWQQFYNCTIVSNAAAKGAGMSFSAGCDVKNCIIWGNAATTEGEGEICKGTDYMPTFINCCSSEELTGTTSCADNIVGDPLFADFANGDYRLTKNSPCIDKGYTKPDAEAMHDLIHRTRPIDGLKTGTPKYDMGCYEFDPDLDAVMVTFTADRPVLPVGADCTLTASFVNRGEVVTGATYEWDFGDGVLQTAEGKETVTHAFAASGRYPVSVRATFGALDETWVQDIDVYVPDQSEVWVSPTGASVYPYDTEAKAATDLAEAVAAAHAVATDRSASLTVLIAPGTYTLATTMTVGDRLLLKGTGTREETVITTSAVNCRVLTVTDSTLDTLTVRGGDYQANRIALLTEGFTDNARGYTLAIRKVSTGAAMVNCVVEGITSSTDKIMYDGNLAVYDGCSVRDSLLKGGSARFENGAAVYLQGGVVDRCEITGGHATSTGGGVHINASGRLVNSLVHDNVSEGSGGGVRVTCWSWQQVCNCTITGNTAAKGAGISFSSGCDLANDIIWGNVATGQDGGQIGYPDSVDYLNILNCCCSEEIHASDRSKDNIVADPKFVDAQGGDFRLSRGSACIDSGSTKPSDETLFDMLRRARPVDGTGDGVARYDMGCYEFDPALDAAMVSLTRTSAAVIAVGDGDSAFTAELVSGGSVVSGTTYTWDFGDGSAPYSAVDATEVSHAYANPGVYDVSVLAEKGTISERAAIRRAVTVHPADPVARVHVSKSGSGAFPYASAETAARSVQDAVFAVRSALDLGREAAEIVVGDGTYLLSDEIVVDNGMRLVSENGPEATRLVQTNANHRLAVIRKPGLVSGFTLVGTNFTEAAVASDVFTSGGGIAYLAGSDGAVGATVLSNCHVTGFLSTAAAGSRYGALYGSNATLADCRVFGNGGNTTRGSAGYFDNVYSYRCAFVSNVCISGGTVWSNSRSSFYNCLIADNVATESEPGYCCYNWSGSYIHNCTIAGNRAATGDGAGIHIGQGGWTYFRNCVIAGNFVGETESNIVRDTDVTFTRCCSPEALNGAKDTENIQAAPVFADAANGNYRLASSSPCIDAGKNSEAPAGTDLDGNERIVDGKHTGTPIVDIGCYEYAPSADETLVFISRTSAAETLVGAESAFAATVVKGGEDVDPADVSYAWSFGDGETESGVGKSTVTHGYAAGTYSVTLTVTVGGVEASAEMPNAVTAYGSSVAYVSNDGSDTWPYDEPGKATPSPEKALTYVRKAVAAGFASGEVILRDGDYEINQKMTLDFAVTMRSENGPEKTVIRPVDNKPITMVSVTGAKATLAGVTLADARNTSTFQAVALSMSNGLATNCVIRGIESGWSWNAAPDGCALSMSGGLAVEMTITNNISPSHDYCLNASPVRLEGTAVLDRAVIADNEAGRPVGAWITSSWNRKIALAGGGVYLNGANAVCRNAFITGNRTVDQPGAGAYVCAGTLENCTVSGNRMMSPTNTSWSAGVYAWPEAKIVNCIVDGNENGTTVINAGGEDEADLAEAFTYCCLPGFSLGGVGCLTDDPRLDGFVPNANVVGGKGRKAPWMKTAKDLVGRRRLIGGKVDIGCYETDFTCGLMLLVR